MSESQNRERRDAGDARLANVFGALALAVTDRMRAATEGAAGQRSAGPAALVMLSEFRPGASVEELRHAIGLTHSGTVRLVDRLVADRDVERRAADDGRAVALYLTAKGRRTAARIRAARTAAIDDALAPLAPTERATFARLADKLLRGVVHDRLAERDAGTIPPDGWLCRLCDPTACGRPDGHCPAVEAVSSR
jgi:MarR family transcriptional repressor of emrRAB